MTPEDAELTLVRLWQDKDSMKSVVLGPRIVPAGSTEPLGGFPLSHLFFSVRSSVFASSRQDPPPPSFTGYHLMLSFLSHWSFIHAPGEW